MNLIEINDVLGATYALHQEQDQLKFKDEYALAEQEIQKLFSLYNDKPDYQIIITNALKLIAEGSNDILIISYLAYALLEQYQWQGLLAGLSFLNTRLTHFWDNIYPVKIKARMTAISWLLERYQRFLTTHQVSSLSEEFLKKLLAKLQDLDAMLNSRFNGEINILGLIRPLADQERRLIEERKSKVLQAERDALAARQQAEQDLRMTLEQNAENISAEEYLNQIASNELHQIAFKRVFDEHITLLQQNPLSFSIYKHHRAELWWEYPWSFQEILTRLDAKVFDWETYAKALHLKLEEEYQEALIAFEAFFYEQPYFLELQMHICDCLEALEADPSLINMIKNECQVLCEQYPDLTTAKIHHKIPLLSKQAKDILLQKE